MSVRYMLDTNTISYIAKGRSTAAVDRFLRLGESELACVSVVSEAEIRYGLSKRPHAIVLAALMEEFLSGIPVLPWGREEARAYGSIRASMEREGRSIGNMDMMIAAHAVATDAILVTHDKALAQVAGLRASVNWATDL